MNLHGLQLVTIVVESLLRDQLCEKVLALGATGYTTTECGGYGGRGARSDAVSGGNVRIETICARGVAEAILHHVSHHCFANYACVAWVSDVEVVRGDHYVKQ